MASLKEIFERAQQTGKVEYTYFGGTNVSPFNQTQLSFGSDQDYGAGNSRQPYIQLGYDPKLKFTANDPTGTINKLLASGRDIVRITKFFTDFPNGPLWLAKQSVLQISNPDMSYKTTSGRQTVGDKLSQIKGPRFYNPLGTNTLAEVGAVGLGIHFTRHGLSPISDPENVVGYTKLNQTTPGTNDFVSRLEIYKYKTIFSTKPIELNQYQAGPDSTFGIGKTTTTTYGNSFGLDTGVTNKNVSNSDLNGFKPFDYALIQQYSSDVKDGILTKTTAQPLGPSPAPSSPSNNLVVINPAANELVVPGNSKIQDFRKPKGYKGDNYSTLNLHNRIGMTTGRDAIGTPNTVDSINMLKITPAKTFYDKSNSAKTKLIGKDIYTKSSNPAAVVNKTDGYYGRDIIRFRIEALNNNTPLYDVTNSRNEKIGVAPNTEVLAFRAYLDDFSDSFDATWKPFNYMGRGEDFYTYEKFSRKMSIGFKMFAHSADEMASLYTKLNYLMSIMTPDYNRNLQMRGNYVYMTVGEYIYRQPGIITSLQVGDLLSAPWEIALTDPETRATNTGEDIKQYEVPKYMSVKLQFTPIHDFLPKRVYAGDGTKPVFWKQSFVTPNPLWYPSPDPNNPNKYLPSQVTQK